MYELLTNSDTTDRTAPAVHHAVNAGHREMIRAVFCDEFSISGVDHETLNEIGNGGIDRWVSDLQFTGMFLPSEVEAIARVWSENPASLISALVGTADEMARRRSAQRDMRPLSFDPRESAVG